MKTGQMMVLGLAVLCAMTLAGEAMARGGNGGGNGSGGGSGYGVQTQTRDRVQAQSTTTRPADSQRRDGTFLTTGTTASGATTRPSNGKGVQDGSGLTTTTTPAAPAVTE
jgi:hypothetical protein